MGALKLVACLVLAVPFGWVLGVAVAAVVTGGAVGVLPILTIPAAILAALVFAVLPRIAVETRLRVLGAGTVALWAVLMVAGTLLGL